MNIIFKKPLKVIHVIETLGTGGAERLLVTLLPELVRQGMDAEVAVQRGRLDLKPELEAAGIPVHILPPRRKWSLLSSARDIAKLGIEQQADILHAHLYFPTLSVALARWTRLWRGVTVVSFHNLAYGGANPKGKRLKVKKFLGRFIVARGIDLPQGVSQAVVDHYASAYCLDNISTVYNPVDLKIIEQISKEHGRTVVLPGRLVHEKGHLDLIAAIAQMPKPHPQVIFVGDGPMREVLEVTALELGVVVTFTGVLPHLEALQVVASAGVVAIPSRYEGFGLTALEAMALGRPIVATTAGGLPEVMGDVGCVVPPGDVQALSQALQRALVDEDLRKTQAGMGPVRAAQFSLPVIAKRQVELYRSVMRVIQ